MTNPSSKYQKKYLRRVLKSISKNDPNTREVVLNGFPFQEETTASLTMSLVGNTHVRILYLHNCGITARGAHLLAYALTKNSSIEHLWLNGNCVGSAGAEALANALRENRTLKTLGLGENDIGNHGGKRINESLKYNNVITDIFLEGNRMSERIVDEVCRRCDRTEHEPQECKFSCGSSVDPLEDLDASTVMSSVTSSYARRMLESIEEESEEDQDDEESDSDDSSTVFDHDISCMIADMTTRATRRKNDRLGKLKSSFVRILHRGRREVAHR
jgi:Ran GTPase-activating protein (RanGAP) involved in mRNA processing and transport